ncbi:MAG: NADPH2:quinone reductase [Paracrocinitomix sp.]|jgi:NADPH2:quinone reductase
MHAIQISETGGPQVMTFQEVEDPTPATDGIVVQVGAAGVNYIDTYHRSGLYDMALPLTLGLEGSGTVTSVGADAGQWSVGDKVAWTGAIGSYAEQVAMPAASAVAVPDGVGDDVAAASMLQGLTAHYLVDSTYPLNEGDKCVVHAAAGGVGLLLVQMAKMRGAEVFATVGTDEKAALARGAGADHVIMYRDVDFAAAIEDIAGPNPIDVVYDGVGATTFDGGLRVLRRRGVMATFGNASGPVPAITPIAASAGKSLFLTRPSLFDYLSEPGELQSRADEMFGWIASGELDVRIGLELPLGEAAKAHEMLEGRQTTGKVLLRP